jgi:CubicO group peptidase (beta-lactamase class C family)
MARRPATRLEILAMRVTANPESVGLCSARLERVREWMRRYLDAGKLPGMLTLVARHGEVVFLDALGWKDVAAGTPIAEDTLFRIYSMTKPVTAVAVMMLYEEGRFQLDDPIDHYLPGFADMQVYLAGAGRHMITEPARTPITIHHLLTHTSGLSYGFSSEAPVGALYTERRTDFDTGDGPLVEVVERLCRLPLICHPGTEWNYGVSSDVLGGLVEVISGQPFDRFLEERVFAPLGMVDTGFEVPPDKLARLATLYVRNAEDAMALVETPANSRFAGGVTTFSGGGGLISTMADYFRFTEMLRREGELDGVRLLGRKTVEYMTCNHLPGDLADMGQPSFTETSFAGIGYGLGVSVMLDPAKAGVVGTPGQYAWGGYASTFFCVDPFEDLTVIFLTQLQPSGCYPLRQELRALTYQALVD